MAIAIHSIIINTNKMAIITKTLAHEIAQQLTSKQAQEVKDYEKEIKDLVYEKALSKIAPEVLEFFEKHKVYCKTAYSVTIQGNGFNYKRVLTKGLPTKEGYNFLYPNPEEAKHLQKGFDKLEDMETNLKKLRKEIEVALVGLRTYKAIELNFPEAAKLLPKIENKVMCINLESLRNQIKP